MKNRTLVSVFAIFFTLAILPSSLFAEEEIAIVLFIVGDVSGTQDGKKVSLKKNSILKKQDELETKDGKVDLQIGPSVVVRISAFTKIKIAELSSDKKANKSKLELVSGKVFARVDKGSKKEDFTITAPSYNAGVRGTQFVVCEENEAQRKENPDNEDSDVPNGIFVKEGEVGVTTENGKNFPLKQDEEAVVSPQGLLKQPLEEFMREKMKILDGFKKIMEENYKILRDQKLQNQELLNQTKQDI
ncbi:FecR family protein [Leptospira johnsonii]|uniref:Sigma factor regulatory protein, FecR/PupR family n=1 Tax=Leptospira johnsonii TaxID=1917820 RepID=A0A2P2D7B6_9LEPT|nr:FecR family protein [Leptospira johnsonii]GBF40505.1 sigma factor regulatory protein, FecR/PupR family [Leptospira johnsonii]